MKMYRIYSFFILFFVIVGWNEVYAQVKNDSITHYKTSNSESVHLIDVRTPKEYKAGHLPHAQNINLFADNFITSFKAIPKEDTIYVYCKTGGRGARAQKKLDSLGYKNVTNLLGGFKAWNESGNPVEH